MLVVVIMFASSNLNFFSSQISFEEMFFAFVNGVLGTLPLALSFLVFQTLGGVIDLSRNLSGAASVDPFALEPRGHFEELLTLRLLASFVCLDEFDQIVRLITSPEGALNWGRGNFLASSLKLVLFKAFREQASLMALVFKISLVLVLVDLLQLWLQKLVPRLQLTTEVFLLKTILGIEVCMFLDFKGGFGQ